MLSDPEYNKQLFPVIVHAQWLWDQEFCVCACTCMYVRTRKCMGYTYMYGALPKIRFISQFSFKFSPVTTLGTDSLCQMKKSLPYDHLADSGHILFSPRTVVSDDEGNTLCAYSLRKIKVQALCSKEAPGQLFLCWGSQVWQISQADHACTQDPRSYPETGIINTINSLSVSSLS